MQIGTAQPKARTQGAPPNRLLAAATEHHRAGRLDQADRLYREVLAASPANADALHFLGALLLQRDGDAASAADLIARALRRRPRDVRMLCNLGTAFRRMGRMDDAEDAFRKACAFGRDDADAHAKLGLTQFENGRNDAALETLAKAGKLAPERTDVPVTRARLHAAEADYPAALAACDAALAIDAACVDALIMRLRVLLLLGRGDDAAEAGRRAVSVAGNDAIAHAALAHALKSSGDLAGSEAECRSAIRLIDELDRLGRPDALALAAGAWFDLSQVVRFAPDTADIGRMSDLRARIDDASPGAAMLDFSIAKALWDGGDRPRAFDIYRRGNALKRATFEFDIERACADLLAQGLRYEAIESAAGAGGETPVFIVGMPRSGTTLAERILGRHPALGAAGEMPYLRRIAERVARDGGFAKADADRIAALRSEYLECAKRHVAPGRRPVDKALNFAHLGFLRTLFPEAPVVLMKRDPVDICVSCFRQLFASEVRFAYDLRELGLYYRAFRTLSDEARARWPDAIHEFAYEDLVHRPEESVRRLLEFCGLPWDERCLDFRSGGSAVLTASAAQVREGIYGTSVGAGRDPALPIGPLLDALGDFAG